MNWPFGFFHKNYSRYGGYFTRWLVKNAKIVYNGKKIEALHRQNVEIPHVVLSCRINETTITAWEKNCPKPGGAAMIPRRNRDLPFGRNSFLFSHKRRYNGNLCARSVQQAKAASSMMTCTLSAPAAYFCQQRCFAQGTCLRRVTFFRYWKKVTRRRQNKITSPKVCRRRQ